MFDLVAAYPAPALNWHDRETAPTLGEGQRHFPGAVSGGLEHWHDVLRGDPDRVAAGSRMPSSKPAAGG